MNAQTARSILGVGKGASLDEVKHAYRKAAQRTHPDKGGTEEAFREVAEAYELLSSRASKEGSGRRRRSYRRGQEKKEPEPLDVGSWLEVHALQLDGQDVSIEGVKAQFVQVGLELLMAIYLVEPYVGGSGTVSTILSHASLGIEPFERKVLQRSHDREGRLTTLWFPPLEERTFVEPEPKPPPPPKPPRGSRAYYQSQHTRYNTHDARSRASGWWY